MNNVLQEAKTTSAFDESLYTLISADCKKNREHRHKKKKMMQHTEITLDYLFQLTMQKKWDQVIEIYKNHSSAQSAKLTKSEETVLHVAVSSYNPDSISSDGGYIKEMIKCIPESEVCSVLSMKNDKGNTPLHLAAAVGWETICDCIASKGRDLICVRNSNNETPLFVAANHGKMGAFLCLHEMYNKETKGQEPDESLCRRKDGNTILHSAISGEYFKLAYLIINYYPKLVNSVNEEGESPLHVLARKPNVFRSSTLLGHYDSIIYQCVSVDKLKKPPYVTGAHQENCSSRICVNYPENYHTFISFIQFVWEKCYKTVRAGLDNYARPISQTGNPPDEENQPESKNETQAKFQEEEVKDVGLFPANYATCILLLKFVMAVILTVMGVGFNRINKIREKKQRHLHAFQIMCQMIESESRYKYDSNGQKPMQKMEPQYSWRFALPDSPPEEDIPSTHRITESNIIKTTSSVKKGTPLLLAAKTGIPEMVEKILKKCPVAIEDLDSEEKNVLLLAAENRQTSVLDFLINMKLPEYLFHQVDDQGNSLLHLAAMLRDYQPWRIPGAALQMQWEIKWYKHVKHSVPPLCFAHNNKQGLTPRQVFSKTHKSLVKESTEWLIKTSESCSLTAALIATVAFATSATVPGGIDESTGYPNMQNRVAFDVFSVTSLVALCLSVTALVFFLAIITSRCQERDFKTNLPRKLLMGLTSLFGSIAAMLVSFCSGHTFILRGRMSFAAVPIYAIACVPVTFFAAAQLPLYFDLLWAACRKVPLRSYKVFFH